MERGGRTLLALMVLGIACLGLAPGASSSDLTQVGSSTAQEQSLLQAINHARTARGLVPLRLGVRLQQAARAHSQAMARSGSFAHGSWYRRLRAHGVRGRVLGETIAWGVGLDGTAAAILNMWLASPSHRATILKPGFRRIGVGVAVGSMGGLPGANIATADFAG